MPRAPNQTALVTGGARGLGLAVAGALARAGFNLALCGPRDPEAAAPALASLRALGVEAAYFETDLARRDARFRLLQDVRQRFGRLHVLVACADPARPEGRDLLELGEDAFEDVMRLHLQGPFFLAQSAALWMLEQREADPAFAGAIVFLGAAPADADAPHFAGYRVAHAGLGGAAAAFAARLAGRGIAVHEVRADPGTAGFPAPGGAPADAAAAVVRLVAPRP